ncbi:hypothetical protein [Deinococcus aquatilis]|uniref:hypothetical protein n=1 Tax=Deinococcus aquatilis TaxID=519440 RepID=UPI00036F7908|nr:hypothetical protein [Deinococcus aquatilis]
MHIKPLAIFEALRGTVRALLFQPDDPAHSPELGLTRLQQIALHQPVYLVRLEGGRPVRVLRVVPFDQLSLKALLPGATAYAAAFKADQQPCLLLVARSPLAVHQRNRPSNAFVPMTEQDIHVQRGKRRKERPKRKRGSKAKDRT